MKKTLKILALACCMILALTACTGSRPPAEEEQELAEASQTEGEEPEPDSSAEDAAEDTGEERIIFPEEELPKNSPEDQAYVEAYMYPFATTGLFRYQYGPDDYSELLESGMMSRFNAFYLHDNPDGAELSLTDEITEVPGDILEGTLMAHLDLTPEQIRESCVQFYDAERHVYTSAFGLGGGPGEFVITESSLEDGVLTLSYDFYGGGGDYAPPGEAFYWMLYERGELVMEIDGDNYKFISNTLQPGPGMEE